MKMLVWLWLAATGIAAAAEDPYVRGQAIADAAQKKAEGYGDMQADARMHIRNGRGGEALRTLSIKLLDLPGPASRGLTIVTAPKDVKGTALLTHTDDRGENEQWLYLPALKRVKRIASSGRSGPFMGSEFSYEDFSAQSPEKYRFKWLREEQLDDLVCDVLERRPKDPAISSYAWAQVWLDRSELRLQKVEFYDQQDALVKTLNVSGYQQYKGRHWRAAKLFMLNARTRAETELDWSGIQFGAGLGERDFDLNSLAATR